MAKQKRYFIISGSNSRLLAGKMGLALTGRHISIEMNAFSFGKYQQFKNGNFQDYLKEGGFPLALSVANPKRLLKEYFSGIIERDVRRQVAARSTKLLMQVAKTVFESAGSELSLRNVAKSFETTADTVKTYLDAFESCYLIHACPYFTYSEKRHKSGLKNITRLIMDFENRSSPKMVEIRERGLRLTCFIF